MVEPITAVVELFKDYYIKSVSATLEDDLLYVNLTLDDDEQREEHYEIVI